MPKWHVSTRVPIFNTGALILSSLTPNAYPARTTASAAASAPEAPQCPPPLPRLFRMHQGPGWRRPHSMLELLRFARSPGHRNYTGDARTRSRSPPNACQGPAVAHESPGHRRSLERSPSLTRPPWRRVVGERFAGVPDVPCADRCQTTKDFRASCSSGCASNAILTHT